MDDLEKRPKYKLDMEIEIGDKTISLNNKKSKLLQCIDKYGSIVKASKETDIPYRTALKNIEVMEKELGEPVVFTQRGGKGGGGSSELTKIGKQVLLKFIKVNKVLKKHTDLNEIEGTISDIDKEKKIMKVALNKKEIVIPAEENFSVGDKAIILISPSDIFVMLEPQKSSARNILEGTITEMRLKNDMIRLNADIDGINIVIDITELSRDELDLTLGKKIIIGFKAASIDILKE